MTEAIETISTQPLNRVRTASFSLSVSAGPGARGAHACTKWLESLFYPMGKIVDWIQSLALSLGAPGLFVASLLDSSFLSLPEINALLLIFMTTQHEARMPLYALSATVGSVTGSLILYFIGKRGSKFTERFGTARLERTMTLFQRYGVMAALIPSIL